MAVKSKCMSLNYCKTLLDDILSLAAINEIIFKYSSSQIAILPKASSQQDLLLLCLV